MRWKWKFQLDNIQHCYTVGANTQERYTFIINEQSAEKDLVLRFSLEAYATLTLNLLVANTSAQIKIECILRGQGAQACVAGAYILSGTQQVKITTLQHHQAAHTTSTLVMKGALSDAAHCQYYGTIHVEKNAHNVNASQENKNMLLSNNARAVSIPNLEVLNNEVKCFHGSAIGKFDPQQLLYMATRGIDEKVAQQYLLRAFFADVFIDNDLNAHIGELI